MSHEPQCLLVSKEIGADDVLSHYALHQLM